MSKYDQLAFAGRPTLYLAAPTTTDQSGTSNYSFSSNSLVTSGQPIIKGHSTSLSVSSSTNAVITGNPVFKSGVTAEFVMLAALPTQETAVILADNGSGVFITPASVLLRVTYNINESVQTAVLEIPWIDWHAKLHCIVTIGSNQIALTVNEKSKITTFTGVVDSSITETQIGVDFASGYSFLMDGFGIYSRKLISKTNAIDDNSRGHNIYAAAIYGGVSTDFSSYQSGGVTIAGPDDFAFKPGIQQTDYLYQFAVPATDAANTYLSVETNDDSLVMDWAVNGGDISSFTRNVAIPIAFIGTTVTFRVGTKLPQDFNMRIEVVNNANIFSRTPAFLNVTGQPVFPKEVDDSIVNCPPGVDMEFASWRGVWLTSDSAAGQNPPKSIEIIFKLEEAGVIFSSTDGSISTAAQTGYTMYLNGALVTDLTGVLMNQWNHLVLTKASPTATQFYLNTDGGSAPTKMSYLLMSAYQQQLDATASAVLYGVSIGVDDITVSEVQLDIAEGTFDNGQPYQLFSNSWAIVGSGGN